MRDTSFADCLDLMQVLVDCRQQPISVRLREVRHRYSMLHEDVLLLIYHFSKIAAGDILEIGAFLGGSAVAAALGVRAAGAQKKIITIEPGGRLKHARLSSRDILRDLKRNLVREKVQDLVRVVDGHSAKPETVAAVEAQLAPESVGLFIFDADAGIDRDLRRYRDLLRDGCAVVVDDYYSASENEKSVRIKPRVDALVASGELAPLGLYGWGTWVGRWRKSASAPSASR